LINIPKLIDTKKIKAFSLSIDSEAIEGPGQNPTMPHPIPNKPEPISKDESIFLKEIF
jgi:hypothetical protein